MTKVKERDRHRRIVTDTIKLEEPSCKGLEINEEKKYGMEPKRLCRCKVTKTPFTSEDNDVCLPNQKQRQNSKLCDVKPKDVFCRRTTKSFTLSSSSVVSLIIHISFYLFIYLSVHISKSNINRDGSQNLMDVAIS